MDIRFTMSPSSLGMILVARTTRGVCAVLLGDDAETLRGDLQERFPKARLVESESDALVARVVGYVEAPAPALDLPLDLHGTAFQQRVWQAVLEIPVGATSTYREVAEHVGSPKGFRAVAQACAANPLAVLIPCHRILRSDGGMSGYRWGLARKRELLAREAKAR